MVFESLDKERTGAELWLDVERVAHEVQNSGEALGPQEFAKWFQELTGFYGGLAVAFKVPEGGPAHITKDGEYKTDGEPVTYSSAEGVIESIGPAVGGGVEVKLDDDSCLILELHGKPGEKAEDCKSGWEATVTGSGASSSAAAGL